MQLTNSLAAAAVMATAMATSLHSNYTFVSTSLSAPAKTATSTGAVALSTGAVASGKPVAPAEVKKLKAMSDGFKFEIIGGICIINNMPVAAMSVSWRLVVDLDLGGKYYFEVCEAEQNLSVVTKVRGEYYFGQAVYYEQTAEGSYDLVCQAQGSVLTQYKVEASAVEVEVKAEIEAKIETKIVKCENTAVCSKVVCDDECAVNVVVKVEQPVRAANANATAPAPAPVKYETEKCESVVKEECNCVKTCVADECEVKKPAVGPAPPALPADKVNTNPAPAPAAPSANPAADKVKEHQPKKPAVAPPAAAANTTGNAKPAAQLGGAGRVAAAFNILAGVVALALFL